MDHLFQEAAEILNRRSPLLTPASPLLLSADGSCMTMAATLLKSGDLVQIYYGKSGIWFPLFVPQTCVTVCQISAWMETRVEERDKTNSISRQEEKPTLLLADPYRKTIFFQRKTQGSDLSFWAKLQKQHEKCFSQGFFSKADAPRIPMTAEGCVLCSPHAPEEDGVYQS